MSILHEAERCLKCKKPMCATHCPINTPIPQIMDLFLAGEIREAGRILFENNPMSAITSIVCPHESNCSGHCVLNKKNEPISFYKIEQYISYFYLDTVKLKPPPSNGIRIAVIGAGPAGISMSIRMALRGFKVTLIEANEKIGGVLRYGIPDFRLPNTIIDKYARIMKDLGIRFKPNTFIGSSTTIEDMMIDGYKAIFISVGTAKPRKLGLLGETLGNVHYAIDYLKSPASYDVGKTIAVVGAGNVAMDAARMAVRHSPGAQVTIINNCTEQDMTCSRLEYEMAKIDGVQFLHQLSTIRITEDHLICARVKAIPGEDGKNRYEEDMQDTVIIPADTVIIAIGQGPQAAVFANARVVRNDRGLVSVSENGETNKPGVFAAGDIVTGPRTVVEAVVHTMNIADRMTEYCLRSKSE